jgi:hypothetical protein
MNKQYPVTYFEYDPGNDLKRPNQNNLHYLKNDKDQLISESGVSQAKTAFREFFPKREIIKTYYINSTPNTNKEYEGMLMPPPFSSSKYYIVIAHKYSDHVNPEYKAIDKIMNPTLYTQPGRGGKKLTRKYRKNKKSKRRRSYKRTYKK